MIKLVNARKRLRKRLRMRAKRRVKRPSRVRVAKKKARKKAMAKKTKKITAASKFTIKPSTSDRRRDSINSAALRSSSRFWMRNSSTS